MAAEQRIQIKRRTNEPSSTEAWKGLLDGELGYIKSTNKLYIGNGKGETPSLISTLSWDELTDKPAKILSQIYINSSDESKIVYKEVGNNLEKTLGNFAPLTNGIIDLKYLPQGALERLIKVANQTARYALTTSQVQLGDTVQEIDTGLMYVVIDESKLNSADGYQVYVAGRAAAVDWTGVENKPYATQTTAGLESAADKKKLDNLNIAYGTCTTAADVSEKVVNIVNDGSWSLVAGAMISIYFSNTNTANNPTLNVNALGGKKIRYGSGFIETSNLNRAGYTNRICTYIYDGTDFRFLSWAFDADTNTQIRVYRQNTSSYNADYPLMASRTLASKIGTAGSDGTYNAVYGLIPDTVANIPTVNPYSGEIKVKSLTASGNITAASFVGNASSATKLETARTIALSGGATGTATSFNGTSNITIPVTALDPTKLSSAVAINKGGTGATTAAQALINLGLTATAAELNYTDGVTSNIQTQLDGKVNLDGSNTMTGKLNITMANYPGVRLDNSTTNTRAILQNYGQSVVLDLFDEAGVSDKRRSLTLRSHNADKSELYRSLVLRDETIDDNGVVSDTYYTIYGQHNKPTPADVGAAPQVDHNIKTYTSFAQLGLDDVNFKADDFSSNIVAITAAMPTKSVLMLANAGSNFQASLKAKILADLGITISTDINCIVTITKPGSTNNPRKIEVLVDSTGKKSIYTALLDTTSGGVIKLWPFIETYNGVGFLSLNGGNMAGHIYMTGSQPSSSTSNTSQLVFGTESVQHIAISANDKALVLNPTTSSSTPQIVLYLNSQSKFPNGINSGNLTVTGTSALNGDITAGATLSVSGASTLTGSVTTGANLTVGTTLTVNSTSTFKNTITAENNVKSSKAGNPYFQLYDGTNNWYFQAVQGDNACYVGPTSSKSLKIDTNGNVAVRGTLTLAQDPTAALQAATKQYVDKACENAAKLYVFTKEITTDGTSSVKFDQSPEINVNTCLVYYNGLLLTLNENYTITDDYTIALNGWTANAGDIFTISGKQANETTVIAAGSLTCGTVGSTTLPVYFNNGVPVACDTLNYAKLESPNNLLHSTNEFTFAKAGYTGDIYINYRTDGMSTSGKIGEYKFCKGDGAGTLANIRAATFYGALSGNASTATKLATARTISLTGDVTGSASFDGSGNISISAKAKASGICYVDGTGSTTEGIWIGTNTDIPSLTKGLTIAYKIAIAGHADGTTLNLTTAAGASGAIAVKRNDSNTTTHLPVNTVVLLTYDGTYWRWADYDSNTNTQMRVYRQTTGYNGDYPILVSRTALGSIGTAGSDGTYSSVYGVIGQNGTYTPTINPHTGVVKIKATTASSSTTTGALIVSGGIGAAGNIYAAKVYGAVWNDYAEYRAQKETVEPGYCVASTDDGKVYKTTEKFQVCDGIVSDTYGFSIGETEKCKTPLAVSGRVLAYCEGDRNTYHSGDVVTAGPNGKVVKMTREEIKEYPDRIIGHVSEIPNYDTWGSGNVKVNGRIWIKIK